MEIPAFLVKRLQENEKIANKFFEIEASILTTLNFKDFFEKLLYEIRYKFKVPYIWISLIKENPIAAHIQEMEDSTLLQTSTVFVSSHDFLKITKNSRQPILANENLVRFHSLMPDTEFLNRISSISIAPISLDGVIVGSINQADQNKNRFQPGIDTSLLEQLALKVSLCLSNVAAHEQLRFLAFHDSLTGLLNREAMKRALEREFERARRYKGDLSLIFLDLDDFKKINDTLGHDVGDLALCHIARAMSRLKRDSDIVARFAGDEFVLIFPSTQASEADQYILRLRDELFQYPLPIHCATSENETEIYIRFSHGIVSLAHDWVNSPQELLKIADERLYLAKKKKKIPVSGNGDSSDRECMYWV